MSKISKLKGTRILVADDEPILREIFREELESKGAIIFEAQDGVEAEEISLREKLDLIISDISMPRRSGLEFLISLRARKSLVPFIAITGYSEKTVEELYVRGADAVVEKPFDTLTLVKELETMASRLQAPTQRKFPRYRTFDRVLFRIPGVIENKRAYMLNLGSRGMFVLWWSPELTPGMSVHFTIELAPKPIEGQGIVRWCSGNNPMDWQPKGFGMEFLSLTAENQKLLDSYINTLTEKSL